MKKIVTVLSLAMAASLMGATWSYDAASKTATDGNWTLRFSNTTPVSDDLCIGYNGTNGDAISAGSGDLDLTEFEQQIGIKVTQIKNNAFRGKSITSLIAPSVTNIGHYIFYSNANITNVVLSPQLNVMDAKNGGAFHTAKNLQHFSPTVIKGVTHFPKDTFISCQKLTGDFVLEDVETLDKSAFKATKITSLSIPKIKTIGSEAIREISTLTTLQLGEDLETIGGNAIRETGAPLTITPTEFPRLTLLDSYAFYITKLSHGLSFPNLEIISSHCFQFSSVMSINAPKAKQVQESAFHDAKSLATVTLSDSITNIGNSAFYNCEKLSGFTPYLPKSVQYLGDSAFRNLTLLPVTPKFECPDLKAIGNSTFYTTAGKFDDPVDFYAPIESFGSYAFLYAQNGQVYNFHSKVAPTIFLGGAFRGVDNAGMAILNVKKRAALAGWSALCAGNEAKFEILKARNDYPGEKTIGVVYCAALSNIGESYHWVVDDTPSAGTTLLVK